jgi:hypothetical protein
MKIITNTKHDGEVCYVQFKDIGFLARITANKSLMMQYIAFINSGYVENDFIKITQPLYVKVIKNCDYIVDFIDLSSESVSLGYLSNLIVTLNFSFNGDFCKECVDHRTDGIKDIIAFKTGEVDFKIPLISNGDIEFISEDKVMVFNSTILENTFVLRRIDGDDIHKVNYYDFYLECIDKIYSFKYPDIEAENRDFVSFDKGSSLVIRINNKIKKEKKNSFSKILSKIKKGK